MTKVTNKQWKAFCTRIIETEGNPSTKYAEKCGIPFGVWFELATRQTKENLVKNAEKVLERLGE